MNARVSVLYYGIAMLLVSACSSGSTPTGAERERAMSPLCAEIFSRLVGDTDVTNEDISESMRGHSEWSTRLELAGGVLFGVAKEGEWKCLDELLDQIGSSGDGAIGVLVLCGAPRLTFPVYPSFTDFELAQSNRLGVTTQQYSEIRLEAARVVAEWFHEAPESWRERYYNCLLWSRIDSIRSREGYVDYIRQVVEGFDEAPEREQWWYVRSAVILMYAARVDLEFDEFTPTAVHEVFDEWAKTVLLEQDSLIPTSDHLHWRIGGEIANLFASEYLDGADESPLPGRAPNGLTYVDVEIHLDATPF